MSSIDLFELLNGLALENERARVEINDRALANTYAKGDESLKTLLKELTMTSRGTSKPIEMTPEQERKLKEIHLQEAINQIHGNCQ